MAGMRGSPPTRAPCCQGPGWAALPGAPCLRRLGPPEPCLLRAFRQAALRLPWAPHTWLRPMLCCQNIPPPKDQRWYLTTGKWLPPPHTLVPATCFIPSLRWLQVGHADRLDGSGGVRSLCLHGLFYFGGNTQKS